MGTGLAASAAHPRRNQIWVPPPGIPLAHQDCPMATAGSIHAIAGGTALIYQLMI